VSSQLRPPSAGWPASAVRLRRFADRPPAPRPAATASHRRRDSARHPFVTMARFISPRHHPITLGAEASQARCDGHACELALGRRPPPGEHGCGVEGGGVIGFEAPQAQHPHIHNDPAIGVAWLLVVRSSRPAPVDFITAAPARRSPTHRRSWFLSRSTGCGRKSRPRKEESPRLIQHRRT